MIEKNKNYTAKELKQLLGDDWSNKIGVIRIPKLKNKPIINNFSEFDDETKDVYLGIYNILRKNNDNFKMWATGSRVKGNWRTKEESDEMAIKYGLQNIKYSDYDFYTDAKNLPNIKDISDILKVKVDLCGFESHKVLVEIIT